MDNFENQQKQKFFFLKKPAKTQNPKTNKEKIKTQRKEKIKNLNKSKKKTENS